MPDRKDSKRSAPVSYRPPKALRGELLARQLRSGLAMNAFITQAIFENAPVTHQSRRPPIEKADLARILNHAAQIRQQLDDIASLDDGDDNASDALIAAATEELAIIRAAILKAMGRQP